MKEESKQDLEKEMFELEEQLDIPSYLRWYNSKPKQETLEEAYLNQLIDEANKEWTVDRRLAKEVAIKFAKWQQERMYSEEEVIELLKTFDKNFNSGIVERNKGIKKWFENFKKK